MYRTRRIIFDKSRSKIQNIFASSQTSENKNNEKVDNVSASEDSSKQKNVKEREPHKKRGGQKKVAGPKQTNKTTTAQENTSKSKTAGRRGRLKGQISVNDENPPKRMTARPKKRYEPNVNSRWNTRSRSRNAANAILNAESTESNEPVEEYLENKGEKEKKDSHCMIVMVRLTPQEIENWSKIRESDKNITSQASESQGPLSGARSESVNNEVNDELETQAIPEMAENAFEQIENDDENAHETHRQRKSARTETDDENLDYLNMVMTSEEERENDEIPRFTSNIDSQHVSADSGYQTGKKPASSHVQEWLNKITNSNSLLDPADVPDDPVLPENDIVLNEYMLSQTPANLTALIIKSTYDKEKDSVNALKGQSQVSTHYSGNTRKSVDYMSVASTHCSEKSELEHEAISQLVVSADARLSSNLTTSTANATTHFSEDEQELETTLTPQMNDFTFTGLSLNRTISVENVSNVSSPKRLRDEDELENAFVGIIRPQSEVQFARSILQPEPKRQKNGSVIGVPLEISRSNRRIVSQPTRDRPEFHPNDFQHTSQPLAIVKARFRLTSQDNSNDDNSLLINTPTDTDYQESNQQRFITQPTQLSHMNWGFSRNSSLETILGTNSSNVTVLPKYRYQQNQEDKTCFPLVPHIHYTSFVNYGETTFAVNDFDHGNANIRHHFLSRFNDSLNGLNENFTGIVYTTNITANLISYYMNVDSSRIQILEFNKTIVVENIKVTALELTSWPGAAMFAFDTGSNGIILHVGDLRIPADTEGIEYLVMNRIKKFYFDQSCLMKVYYQIPNDIDRYVGLIHECVKYNEQNNNVGMIGMIVIGAFKHGMEPLILRLAETLHMKVFMDLERLKFLDRMLDNDIQSVDSVHCRLRERVVDNPRRGHIHILDVDNINENYLASYLSDNMNRSFNRMLAIRPRGNGSHYIQLALNRFIKIIDIPNPLIGDYYEYRRFIECVREDPEQVTCQRQLQ